MSKRKACEAAAPVPAKEIVLECVCPVTQEPPFDPVHAEDGRIYEREAITTWLAMRQTSPATNEPMGPLLLNATHVRNLVRMAMAHLAAAGDEDAKQYVAQAGVVAPLDGPLTIAALGAECTCPILGDWPVDPVVAMDGHVYEREAVTKMLRTNPASYVTKEPMRKTLREAPHVRAILTALAKSADDTGYLGRTEVHEKRRLAEGGDAGAMYDLGCWYNKGCKGLRQNFVMAANWFEQAAEENHVKALCELGWMRVEGRKGVKQDVDIGKIYLAQAMGGGSQWALYAMAHSFEHGLWGHTRNAKRALDYYQKMRECAVEDAPRHVVKDAWNAQIALCRNRI